MADFKKRLLAELKREKKKTAIMAVLLLVAVVLVGRLVLKSGRPATATAAPPKAAPSPQASAAADGDAGQDASAESGREKDKYLGPIDTTIKRDIFTVNPKYFPTAGKSKGAKDAAGAEDVDAERTAIKAQGSELTLQSTVVSANPTAIVDGQVLRVGDWINGFRVVEIGSRQCTLEKRGVRVTIEMK